MMDTIREKKKANGLSAMVLGKVPPQATELEEAVLGAMMLQSSCISDVVGLLFPEAFYSDAHQRVFNAILKLYDNTLPIDILTVVEQLKRTEELETVGGAYYVTRLTNAVVSTANVEAHCHIILQKFLGREMIRISADAMNEAYDGITDIFETYDKADNDILNIQERVLSGHVNDMSHYSAKVYDQYETVKQTGVIGIQTGIVPFDTICSGLVAPDLIIVAARPGQGKTAFALSFTHHISVKNQLPGAWFSLEMDGVQLTRRLASMDAKISHESIRHGKISKEQEGKFYESLDKIGRAPIFIEDKPIVNVRSIRTRANVLRRKNKIGYVVVDYIQLMQGVEAKGKTRDMVIGEISRGLKCLAKELSIPVIALSQLSREVEKRADKMPQQSDLRESGNLEQDADEILFLMRPESYGFTEPVIIGGKEYDVRGLGIGKVDKNRHGSCKNFAMWFDAPCMQYSTHINDLSSFRGIEYRDYTQSQDKDYDPPF
jgi:replicative DNA helicase